jgi:predicted lipoprotein with Yx(FWY)xxD motif
MFRGRPITLLAGAAVPVTALVVAAIGSGASAATLPAAAHAANRSATVSAAKRTVNVRRSSLGKILVDSRGRTLYLFKKDSKRKSACFGACASFWPPLRANGKPTVGRGARASKVGTIRRSDGKAQVTYNGHPLYRFVMDKRPGATNGEGLSAFGARWFAVSPAGKQVSR